MTKNFDLQWKYDMLETLDLDLYGDDEYDVTSQEVLNRVENFLDDIELQKERDRETFDAIRSGAIDEIFAAEYGDFVLTETSTSASQCGDDASSIETLNDEKEMSEVEEDHFVPPRPPPPPESAFVD